MCLCSFEWKLNYICNGGRKLMGTLDQGNTNVVRKIKIIDTTGYTPAQLENVCNTNYGAKGWKIIQIVALGSKNYVLAEKES